MNEQTAMEFEQPYNGLADFSFPSPTQTPTTAGFGNNVFHTPKTTTFPSHFQDAFSTPQMPTYSTPRLQHYSVATPVHKEHNSSETLRASFYANLSAAETQAPVQQMQPPPQQVYGIMPIGPAGWEPNVYMDRPASAPKAAAINATDSSQMQTPPPTRGSSSKKAAQQAQQIAFGTPSTIATRRFNTPQYPAMGVHEEAMLRPSPMQYPQLQFSPDVYQFANSGPATAPVFPQSRVFWDQPSATPMIGQPSALEDPFAPGAEQGLSWHQPNMQTSTVQSVSFNTPAMTGFAMQTPNLRPASASQVQHSVTFSQPPMLEASSSGVDPSLVYSSPAVQRAPRQLTSTEPRPAPSRNIFRKSSGRGRRDSDDLQKVENSETIQPMHSRTDTVSTTETLIAPSKLGLQRSNTTGGARPRSMYASSSAIDELTRSNSVTHAPRTCSPLKRMGRTSLGSISESARLKPRTSVVLTIDENGRARTETKRLDESPTKSIREKYPGLWDSDSSDSESDASSHVPSRSTSFTFPKGEERRSKVARLDPPVEGLAGLTIPRSSSSASMRVTPSRAAIAAAAQLRRQSSARKPSATRSSQGRRNANPASSNPLIDTCSMDVSVDDQQVAGGAQEALRSQVAQSQAQQKGRRDSYSTLEAHNQRWNQMTLEHQQPQQSTGGHYNSPYPTLHNQPVDSAPTTGSVLGTNVLIRCTCGTQNDNGQFMVQCKSCAQWLHTTCVGLNLHQLPPVYHCVFCTGTTPAVRGGGVREPLGWRTSAAWDGGSPLDGRGR